MSRSGSESPTGEPVTPFSLLVSRIDQNPDSQYIEIDQAGERASKTTAQLYRQALKILPQLGKRARAGESDIILCFENALDFIPAAWACIYGGFSFLPWHIPKLLNDCEIRSKLQVWGQKLNHPVLVSTDRTIERFSSLKVWPGAIVPIGRDLGAPGRIQEPPEANSGAFLMTTSGTTGDPKIAVLSHRSLLSRFFARPEQVPGRKRIFCVPFENIPGIIFPGPGDTIFIQPERLAAQPLQLLNIVEEFEANAFSLSTSMAARIYEAAESRSARHDLSSLEHVGFGGEMIVPTIVLKFGRKLRERGAQNLKVWLGYGMTETGPLCQTQGMTLDQLTDHLPSDLTPVSLGSPVAGWSLRVVDDAGNALPAGTAGNIEVWSDTKLFSGYRNDVELTQASFTEDGWFKTGDVGIASPAGLTITGRQKATIIINARNIALELIEAPARQIDGISGSLVAAAPVRLRDSATEEIALFFVPCSEDIIDDLCRRMVREIARHSRVTVKHLVPLKVADFPLTSTGKVRRDVLVDLYQSGKLPPHSLRRSGDTDVEHPLTDPQRWLTKLWRRILKLKNPPSLHDNFFELGGDLLAAAELIFAVEEKFSCELPLEAFFERPTIASMDALLKQHAKPSPLLSVVPSPEGRARLLHKLQRFSGSWRGQRLFSDSLIVGFNTDGCRPPVFWVLQDYAEAKQLAKYLGPEQPLYAMRSCTQIIKVKDYTADVLETVCNRYLWELLALPVGTAFILGGTCQGGILALAMARRLKQIGRAPALLVLLEWSYSYGSYSDPTLLVYGEESYTAEIYRHPEKSKLDWRTDFPQSLVASVPGKHGELERRDDSIGCLAKILREQGGHSLAKQLAENGAKVKELATNLAMSELKELRANVMIRQLKASTSWRVTAPLRAISYGLRRLLKAAP